ncbi:MAG: aromatic ring-hydroxylating dioxygenase subunit alpha [marine benthic group bacterium]|nr:aromatic ring-hydroxylating dioxygenase subunit alpha [Gemmatimonadota bacterium]
MADRNAFADVAEELKGRPALARAETIPSAWFTEPRFHQLDSEAIFARTWQGVGHEGRLAELGSWFVADVAGDPVVVVRDRSGELRAFYNVCRHRGGPLATADGCGRVLQCEYHGWTYQLDGTLRGVPHWNLVELFDREDYGLVPIQVQSWEGQIFVNLDPGAVPLDQVLRGISERISPVRPGQMQNYRRVEYDVRANWKVYVENFLEGYHVPIVHPELMTLYDFRSYKTETREWYSLQTSELTNEENIYERQGGGEAWYYCVFPNYMLNILPGRLQTNLVVPVDHQNCRVVFEYFYDDIESEAARRKIDEDIAFADRVQDEDIDICEHVQRGLQSRGYDRGRFSVKFESGVYHFQNLVREAYGRWLQGEESPITPPEPLDPRNDD